MLMVNIRCYVLTVRNLFAKDILVMSGWADACSQKQLNPCGITLIIIIIRPRLLPCLFLSFGE